MVTGPMSTAPMPIRLSDPITTGPTPLLTTLKSSMMLRSPNSNGLNGSTSNRTLARIRDDRCRRGGSRQFDHVESVGVHLRNVRRHGRTKNLSQRELAARVGVLPQALSRMERERYRGVSFERLSRIIEALGISLQLIATVDPVENGKEQAQE